jgi:type 1 glutamine amidotransferase
MEGDVSLKRSMTYMKTRLTHWLIVPALFLSASFTLSAETVEAKPKAKASVPFFIPPDVNGLKTIIAPPVKTKAIKVAIFDGKGAPSDGIENVSGRIKSIPEATVTRVRAEDWATIDLKQFDVVAFSGGSGSQQAEALGEAGRNNVREYIRGGGGYVGVCAGAYLACSNFKWGLGILNASTVSSKWQRGRTFLDIEVTQDGQKLLGDIPGTFKVRYANGPVIKPAERRDIPAYTTISVFRSEIALNGSPAGVQVNSPAQALGTFGKGRVFISSPHPENTPGLEHLIPRGVLWAAGVDTP